MIKQQTIRNLSLGLALGGTILAIPALSGAAPGGGDPNAAPAKPRAQQNSAAPRRAAPAAQPAQPAVRSDEAERQKILQSREWRETRHAFNEWLSVQKIYSPAEVKKIRASLDARIARMSPDQLNDFLEDSRDKMAILMSKEAEDARSWLAQRMAVEVRATPEQIRELRPDVVHMTAAQLQESLQQLEAQRNQVRQTQQAFDTNRRDEIKGMQRTQREEEREREDALNRAYADQNSSPYGNYYGPSNNPTNKNTNPVSDTGLGGGFWFGFPY